MKKKSNAQKLSTKKEIVRNWLPRYTGMELKQFGEYIILVNFQEYLNLFADKFQVEIYGENKAMQAATSGKITILNFGMGSPNAATVMDLLSAISPKACLFLGKCGGIKSKNKIGDLILPIAAIRGDGTSNDYFPKEVPALPSFALQKAISTTIREYKLDYWTGTVYTSNRRVWEHDEKFKAYLKDIRCMGIDMETATLFSVAFFNKIPAGALLLVSDMPMTPDGVKTRTSDIRVSSNFVKVHLDLGIDSLMQLINNSTTVRHLKF